MSTQTTTQHTPGPWTVTDEATACGLPHRFIANCGDGRSVVTQETGNNASHDAAEATARLIAAAPELLSALEEAGEALTSALSVINAEDDTGKAYPKTREAIRNAQGKRFAAIDRATS